MNLKSKSPIWEQAPMLRLTIALALGVILFDNFEGHHFTTTQIYGILILSFSLLIISYRLSLGSILFQKTNSFCSLVSVVILGFSISYFHTHHWQQECLDKKTRPTNSILVILTADPIEKSKTIKYEVSQLNMFSKQLTTPVIGKAFVYSYKDRNGVHLEKGDTILLPNNWQSITNAGNPYELDYKKHCARKNIHFQQFLSPKQIIIYGKKNSSTISLVEKAHQYCIFVIDQHIKDSTASALLKALLVGDERDIDPNIREAYSDTGIIHIISISGAHVAILFTAITLLLRFIKNKKYDWLKFLISLILIWFYVLLAGASTPALRAALMFTILALGTIAQRQRNPINQLLGAAFILLLFQPMWLFNIGFQLSFVAVLSLITFYPPLISLYQSSNKIKQFFANTIAVSIAAEILVAPLVAYYFHSFPPMFILANVFASLLMTSILVLGISLLILAKISSIASILSSIIIFLSQFFHFVINLLQRINFPVLKTIFVTPIGLVLLYISIGTTSIFILQKRKNFIWISAVAMALLSILHFQKSWQIRTQQKLIVFNENKRAHIELLKGNTYEILSEIDTETFASKNVHIAFGATHQRERKNSNILLIDQTKIILLDDSSRIPKYFPVDIIVLKSWNRGVDIPRLANVFNPKKIVISGTHNKHRASEWRKQCNAAHIALHNTKTEGAFVYP